GAMPHKSDDGAPLEAAERVVLAMKVFITISADAADKELKESFVWKIAAEPLLELNDREVLDTFLYHVAALGRVEGAAQRLNQQSAALDKLSEVMAELSKRWESK